MYTARGKGIGPRKMDLPAPDFFDRVTMKIAHPDQSFARGTYMSTSTQPLIEAKIRIDTSECHQHVIGKLSVNTGTTE
jgi:hypothetical protein